ncbi:MAG: hypothetical protein MI725_01445, partial [Pirellulales bacterium]|nr:hypothetical protein [Pirellulales bacterium]
EDFIASLWNVEIHRHEQRDIYYSVLDFFKDVIPTFHMWNLQNGTSVYERSECTKIPSSIAQLRDEEFREFLDSALEDTDLRFAWRMIRAHLHACHIYISWQSISIRPITPPTFDHPPFAHARQRLYMSATLGAGGELERITGVRRIQRLPVPEDWEREGTGRRFILFPERSLPPETAASVGVTLAADTRRSLVLAPNRHTAETMEERFSRLSPKPEILTAQAVEQSLQPFLEIDHAALVLHNRYDGLDLPGEACHFEWICGLPGATNAQEMFMLNRLKVEPLLRDRIRTRLTQALGRCTRHPTDYALVIVSGPDTLDFCNKVENRTGFHPELQAEIEYGLDVSQVQWPKELVDQARAFLERRPGWEQVEDWIRDMRDSYVQEEDKVASTLMNVVREEIDYSRAIWVGDYDRALEKARACADRLGGVELTGYRAWWYYLAGSVSALLYSTNASSHLREATRDLCSRACNASPTSTWFREAARYSGFEDAYDTVDDLVLLAAAEAIEARIQQVGVVGAAFEHEAQDLVDKLGSADWKTFEQGLERLGKWLGVDARRPAGEGVPDGVWSFSATKVVGFEAKSNEQASGAISVSTARQTKGHIDWIKTHMPELASAPISAVLISDRTTRTSEAIAHSEGVFVIGLEDVRELAQAVVSTIRALRAQSPDAGNEDFRQIIASRFKSEQLDPQSIMARFGSHPLAGLPVHD